MLDKFIVVFSWSSNSWVNVSNSVAAFRVVLSFALIMVVTPDDMMVHISLVVVSVEVAEFVGQLLLDVPDIFNSVVRNVMMAEVVFTVGILVPFTWVMLIMTGEMMVAMLIVIVLSVVIIMVVIKVNAVTVMVMSAFS